MKHHLLTLIAVMALAMPFAAAARNFVVEDTEGNLHKFAFSSKLTWAISGNTLEVDADEEGSDIRTFLVENVAKMTYDNEASVKGVSAEKTASNVTFNGSTLTITGLKPHARVTVTNVSGQSFDMKADAEGTLTASLDQWPAGVYVVSAGESLIFKFLQK